jgi:uncharacterized protein YkwD
MAHKGACKMLSSGHGAWSTVILSTLGVVLAASLPKPVLGWQTDMPGACTPGPDWGQVDPAAAATVLALVNGYRAQSGLPALVPNPALAASATWKSLHMGRFGYFGHADPAPPIDRSPFERAVQCGYGNSYIGEDIAAGQESPSEAVEAWMTSSSHRAIIESPAYFEAGVGAARSPAGRFYWTLDVGRGPI